MHLKQDISSLSHVPSAFIFPWVHPICLTVFTGLLGYSSCIYKIYTKTENKHQTSQAVAFWAKLMRPL